MGHLQCSLQKNTPTARATIVAHHMDHGGEAGCSEQLTSESEETHTEPNKQPCPSPQTLSFSLHLCTPSLYVYPVDTATPGLSLNSCHYERLKPWDQESGHLITFTADPLGWAPWTHLHLELIAEVATI